MRARKALGQHFLSDPGLLARIAAATGAGPGDVVLEIGPGRGSLTEALVARGATVVAIERDVRMLPVIQGRIRSPALTVVVGDALATDWPSLVASEVEAGKRWLVAGNIPYNITTPLLDKALTPPLPASVTFLVQRELADRVAAAPRTRTYGALSIGVQAVAGPKRLFAVDRRAFSPAPRIDSTLLQLIPRRPPLVTPDEIAPFRRFVTGIFCYRRKRIANALRQATGMSGGEAVAVLQRVEIDPGVRPEALAPDRFADLFRAAARMVVP